MLVNFENSSVVLFFPNSSALCPSEGSNQSKRVGSDILQRLHAVVNEAYEHAKNDENLSAILNSLLAYKPSERDTTQTSTGKYPHAEPHPAVARPRNEFDCRPFLGPKTPPSPNSKFRDELAGQLITQRPQDPRRPVESETHLRRGDGCTCCQEQHSGRATRITQRTEVYEDLTKSGGLDPRCYRSPGRKRSIVERRELHESSRDSASLVCEDKRAHWTDNGGHSDLSPNRTERLKRTDGTQFNSSRKDRVKDVCVCASCLANDRLHLPTDVRSLHPKQSESHGHWSVSPTYASPPAHRQQKEHYQRSTSGRLLKETTYLSDSHVTRTFLEMPHRSEHSVARMKQHSRAVFDRTSRPRSPCIIDNESYRNRRNHEPVRPSRHHCETHILRNSSNGEESRDFHTDNLFRSKRFSPFLDCDRKSSRACKSHLGICHHTESPDLAVRFNASCSKAHGRRRSPDVRTSRQGVVKRSHVRTSRAARSNHYCGPPSPYTVVRSYRVNSMTADSPKSPTPPTHEQQILSRYSSLGRLQMKQGHCASSQSPLSPACTQAVHNPRECLPVASSSQGWVDLTHTTKLPSVVSTCAVQQSMRNTDENMADYQARGGTDNHDIIDTSVQQEPSRSSIRGSEAQKNSDTVDYGDPVLPVSTNQSGDEYSAIQSERRSVSASSSRSSCSSSSQTSSSGTSESGDTSSSSGSSSAGSGTESDHSGPIGSALQSVPAFTGLPVAESMELKQSQSACTELNTHTSVSESNEVEREEVIPTSPTEPSIQIAVETTWDDAQGAEIETDYAQSDVIHLNVEIETSDTNLLADTSEPISITAKETERVTVHGSPGTDVPTHVNNPLNFITADDHIQSPRPLVENTESNRDVRHKRSDHRRKSSRLSDENGREKGVSRLFKANESTLKTATETHCSAEEEGEVFSDGTSDVDENQSIIRPYTKHAYDVNESDRVTGSTNEIRCLANKRPRSPNSDDMVRSSETKHDLKRHKTCRITRSQTNDMDKFKAPPVPKSIRYERFESGRDLGKDHSRNRFHSVSMEDKLRDMISRRSGSYDRNNGITINSNTRSCWNRNRYHSDLRPLHLRGRYSKHVYLQTSRPRGHRCNTNFESAGSQRYSLKSRVFYRTTSSYLTRNGGRFVLTSSGFDRGTTQRREFDLRDYKLNRLR